MGRANIGARDVPNENHLATSRQSYPDVKVKGMWAFHAPPKIQKFVKVRLNVMIDVLIEWLDSHRHLQNTEGFLGIDIITDQTRIDEFGNDPLFPIVNAYKVRMEKPEEFTVPRYDLKKYLKQINQKY
jgi:hypothetical protein